MTVASTVIPGVLEDAFFSWALNNSPALLTIAILVWLIWWIRGQLSSIDNRISKLESDVVRLDKTLKSFGKRLTRVERKLDMLIVHLTSTKKIDSDVPLH